MRQGFEADFFHHPPPPRPKGGKLQLMRNGYTAGFGHYLGTKKIWRKKIFFFSNIMTNKVRHIYICLTHMIVESFLIFKIEKKKTKELFLCGKNIRVETEQDFFFLL